MIQCLNDRSLGHQWPQPGGHSHPGEPSDRVRTCALFVDFDNCYIHLTREYSDRIATQFASDPDAWSSWLLSGTVLQPDAFESSFAYRVLLRRVYLNPCCGGRFRNGFVRSGFEVIDTPSLTSRLKNAADIRMALDLVDELTATPRIHTFVVMSGDADFTPVIQRIRRRNRHSVIVSVTNVLAQSYASMADRVVMPTEFLRYGLGLDALTHQSPTAPTNEVVPQNLLQRVADRLRVVASETDGIAADQIHRVLSRSFPEEFPDSNWFGFYSLNALADRLVATNSNIQLVGSKPWRLVANSGESTGTAHIIERTMTTDREME